MSKSVRYSKKEYEELLARRGGSLKPLVISPASLTYTYRGTKMRSSWEVDYAAYLDVLALEKKIMRWDYEPERFLLGKKCSYLPDFRVITNDYGLVYIEVKGYNREAGNVKFKTAANNNPHALFVMVRMKSRYPIIRSVLGRIELCPATLFGRWSNADD